MGIRKSTGKNKKSGAATERNAVQREAARRQTAREQEKDERRPPAR
jgi:hypothetical protein